MKTLHDGRTALEKIFETHGDAYWEFRPQEQQRYISPRISTILGCENAAPFTDARRWEERLHPDDLNKAADKLTALLEGSLDHYECEIRVRNKEGAYLYLLERAQIGECAPGGTPSLIIGSYTDISETRQTAERLHQLKEHYYALLEDLGEDVVFYRKNVGGIIEFVSQNVVNVFGTPRNRVLGRHFSESIAWTGGSLELADATVERILHGETDSDQIKMTFAHPVDGRVHTVRIGILGVRDEAGNVTGFEGSARDVTEPLFREQRLKPRNQQLREAQRLAKIGSWTLDFATHRETWSDEIYRILGYDPEKTAATYESFLKMVHPDEREQVKATFFDAVKNRTPYAFEFRLKMDDGSIKNAVERGEVVYDSHGEPLFAIGTVQDITERKALESTLLAERTFIASIVDTANAVICVIEPDGTMSRINRYGEEFIGYTQREIASEPYFWARFLPADVREKVREIVTLANRGEIVRSFQNSWVSKRGEERMFEWSNQLILHEDGSMDSIFAIGIDISEKLEIKQLALQKEEFETIFNSAKDGLAILDLAGNFLKFNDSYLEITGYTRDELLTLSCIELAVPKFMPRARRVVAEAMENGHVTNVEIPYYRKDDSVITINMSLALMPDGEHLLMSAKDMTQERAMRQERENLLQEQTSLLSLFDKGDAVLFKWKNNTKRRVEYVSHNIDKLLGLSYETFMSNETRFVEYIHPDDVAHVFEEVQTAVAAGADFFKHDPYRVITHTGEVRWVLHYTVTQKNRKGRITHFIGHIADITEQKESEIRLKQAKEEAEQAARSKSEFLANMSHEIRTPLNAILGFVEHLAKDERDPMRYEEFRLIKSSGRNLLTVINDVLDFSKIESGKIDIDLHPHRVADIFRSAVAMFHDLVRKKKIRLGLEMDGSVPETLLCDEVRLKQVLFNLLGNAIKFTNAGGSVVLHVRYEGGRLHCAVQDTGIGIAPDKQEKIFKAFDQEDTSTTRKYGGTGLGLSISSRLVALMGGTLHVQSSLSEGSRFFFDIAAPQCRPDAEGGDAPGVPEAEVALHSRSLAGHLLVVEDIMTNQILMGIILKDLGLSYDMANDGVEAVQKFKENRYDAILMDENMPNMNGIDAAKHIRTAERERRVRATPIIAVTANALKEDRERFLAAGMDDYISKPYEAEDIRRLLDRYLADAAG